MSEHECGAAGVPFHLAEVTITGGMAVAATFHTHEGEDGFVTMTFNTEHPDTNPALKRVVDELGPVLIAAARQRMMVYAGAATPIPDDPGSIAARLYTCRICDDVQEGTILDPPQGWHYDEARHIAYCAEHKNV